MTRLLIAFTLLCGPLAFAHEARPPKSVVLCEESLRPSFESWAEISNINGPIVSEFKPNVETYELFVGLRNFPRVEVGHMKIELEGDTLHIREIFLNNGYKEMGISTYLFAKALAMFPQATRVQGKLFFDNAEAFNEELAKSGNQVYAFKATPFYKVFKKLGFSDIDFSRSYVTKDFLGLEAKVLTLQKPESNPLRAQELAKPKSIFRLASPPKPPMY